MRTCLLIVISILLLSGCGVARRPHRGSPITQWEIHNNSFKVRISEYVEKDALISGAYYVFESAPLNSDSWQPVMTFRHDDQVGIPKDQVRFVDQQIGYAFMGWMFAITKDGGSSWAVWDATKDLPDWQCCNYGLIRDVSISADGSGVMKLSPVPERRGEVPGLRSQDYGQHWSAIGKAV